MKLLILTQKVDKNDPILGFFHRWVEEFAKHCEQIIVICLQKGEYRLPANVRVLSLGKEKLQALKKFWYILNFFRYIWQERKNYNSVFVHMNQEYVLLAGWWWRLLGKKVMLWRNHHSGNWLTDLAALFCDKIFCTSRYSFTAKYKKTTLMPVGVDTEFFKPDPVINITPRSVLFLSRIAPVKKPEVLIKSLKILQKDGIDLIANFYGDALPQFLPYYQRIKKSAPKNIFFHRGVPNDQTVKIYRQHQVFVNLSSSGMYDKTIFEAASCGVLSLSSNKNLLGEIDAHLIFRENDAMDLATKIKVLMTLPDKERQKMRVELRSYVIKRHSLKLLVQELFGIKHASI